ncbi:MAG: HAMP domain-containing histidine kinase [Cyclobacteriaceae bacterium]|nr:HAMP domain-containing histidine kinase [Cyclobacteriaceae bacterium]
MFNLILCKDFNRGIGIDELHHNKVFDLHYKATSRSGGSGLGLYLVRKAVSKLRGQISFTSKVGEGTVFKLKLPYRLEKM